MGAALSLLWLGEFPKNVGPDYRLEGAESEEVSGLPSEEVEVSEQPLERVSGEGSELDGLQGIFGAKSRSSPDNHTMRPLSVDKLNIVISRLYSGQTTCQISSSTGFSIGTISKIHSEHFSDLPKSSSGYPGKLSLANVCHAERGLMVFLL